MTHLGVGAILLAGACSTPSTPSTLGTGSAQVQPPSKTVGATLGVTAAALADDCGEGQSPAAAPDAPAAEAESAKASGDGPSFCEQSSVQLLLTAVGNGPPGPVVVRAIELLDQEGKHVGAMVGRTPRVWTGDAYGPWDATLRPGDSLRLSVPSSAPPWGQLSGGRWSGQLFQVRVTVTVGGMPYTANSAASVTPAPMIET